MLFVQPPLPWDANALDPHIPQEIIDIHYGKHHAGYIRKLNAAVEGTPDAAKSLEELVKRYGDVALTCCP